VLDPARPEGLLYGRTDHHGLVLIGAFYLMEPGEHGPQPGGCLTTWHTHNGNGIEMLHVWTVDMPGGPFANEWDPAYIASL
jgi:hypothetical protein